MDAFSAGFMVYGIVLVVTTSELFKGPRRAFRELMVKWGWTKCYAKDAEGKPIIEDNNGNQEIIGYDFISCAMCTGVWVAALTCLWQMGLRDTIAAYGVSYFLKTQERP